MLNNVVFIPVSLENLEEIIEKIIQRSLKMALSEHSEKPDETLITTEEVCKEFRVSRMTLLNPN